MLIIPAIDIKDGCVVRLVQGRRDEKIYSRDPLKTARHWVRQGAQLLHIVDLDGARTGIQKNLRFVKDIVKTIDIKVELGGGVRKIETIRELLKLGIYRVVLGTQAVEDKSFLKKAFGEFRDKIIVSIDTKESNILIKGWQENSKTTDLLSFVLGLKDLGFKEFLYTDTLKDGTLKGPNIRAIKTLLQESGMCLIASGGISSLDDIGNLGLLEKKGLTGVIVGKALYEGNFTLPQALQLA